MTKLLFFNLMQNKILNGYNNIMFLLTSRFLFVKVDFNEKK